MTLTIRQQANKMRNALEQIEGEYNSEDRFREAVRVEHVRKTLEDDSLARLYRIITAA